jgi:hypothetical protein
MSRRASSINLPFSNARLKPHKPSIFHNPLSGSGMGSVLLRKGGPGGASSYQDIDEYISTTGINPYARSTPSGRGLSDKIGKKLSNLKVEAKNASELPKRKKIVMSM